MGQLQKNLRALETGDAALAKRLGFPVASEQVRREKGQLQRLSRRVWLPLALDATALQDCQAAAARAEGRLALFGLGDGAQVLQLLSDPSTKQLLVWDRDPWLLRLFLDAHDLAQPLRTGQLKLLLASDLIDLLAFREKLGPKVDELLPLWPHPTAQRQYATEWKLCAPVDKLVANAINSSAQPWACVVTGELFVDDLEEALSAEGYRVFPFEPQLHSIEELSYQLVRMKPSLVAAINYKNGLAELCERLRTKLISWEIDPTTDKLRPLATPCPSARIFTYRRAQTAEFAAAGFSSPRYLPLAANPERRKPPGDADATAAEKYRAGISFVGASLQGQVAQHTQKLFAILRERDRSLSRNAFATRLRALLDEQKKDPTRYRVPELFPQFFEGGPAKSGSDPIQLAGELAAAESRAAILGALGPLQIQVWGDEGFRELPGGCIYRGPAGHFAELNQIYGRSVINFDLGRVYQPDIVTMRVFDALSCGGFVLTQKSDALAELFELEKELATFSSLPELVEKARHYLARPEEAKAIAARGRERVLRDHTIRKRVAEMLRAD